MPDPSPSTLTPTSHSSEEEVVAGHSGQFTPGGYLSATLAGIVKCSDTNCCWWMSSAEKLIQYCILQRQQNKSTAVWVCQNLAVAIRTYRNPEKEFVYFRCVTETYTDYYVIKDLILYLDLRWAKAMIVKLLTKHHKYIVTTRQYAEVRDIWRKNALEIHSFIHL